jgi:hypothetical protein
MFPVVITWYFTIRKENRLTKRFSEQDAGKDV